MWRPLRGSVGTRVVRVGCRLTAAIRWSLSRPLVLWGVGVGLFRVVLAADVELCLRVVAPWCVVVMMMMGGHFVRAPFSRWVGLSFPPGGFSGSLPLRNAGRAHICHRWFWRGGVPCCSCGSLLSCIVVGRLSPSLLHVRVLARPLVVVAAAQCAAGLHARNLAGIVVPPGGVDSPPLGCIVGASQVVAWLRWRLCVLSLRSGIRMVKGFLAASTPLTRRWMSVRLGYMYTYLYIHVVSLLLVHAWSHQYMPLQRITTRV